MNRREEKHKKMPRALKLKLAALILLEYPIFLLVVFILDLLGIKTALYGKLILLLLIYGIGASAINRIIAHHYDKDEKAEKIDF